MKRNFARILRPLPITLAAVVVAITIIGLTWPSANNTLANEQRAQRVHNAAKAIEIWDKVHIGVLSNVSRPRANPYGAGQVVNINVDYTAAGQNLYYDQVTVWYDPAVIQNGNRVLFWTNHHYEYRRTMLDTTPNGVFIGDVVRADSTDTINGAPDNNVPWTKATYVPTYDSVSVFGEIMRQWFTTSTGLVAVACYTVTFGALLVITRRYRRNSVASMTTSS